MPGATTSHDTELIIEKKNGDGSGKLPPAGGNGGGDAGKNRPKRQPSPSRYYTGIAVGIVSVLMFFMALASAFLVRKGSPDWVPVHIPWLLWVNTAVLVTSSGTLEMARKRLAHSDVASFRTFWLVTTLLGVLFLVGQVVAWRILVGQGIYLASNPASSFFYIFTGAHGLHLAGGVGALICVAQKNFDAGKVTRTVAAEITSYYWHFMDALWLFLLALLYLGR
ncbi:MAG TPA: heme-copper oxidase subunit III [Candidatus Limnocylindrales bacterium]|nr:heme-copper oxidase subunit III [Candidatus Limnocylindrales bacterium]